MPKLPKHILVIRLSAMGDIAMVVPVLRAFAQRYPKVKLTVLTRAFFAPFFRDIPNVRMFSVDVKNKHKGLKGLYKLSKELKALDIDAVADLHNVLRTKILKIFLNTKRFTQVNKGRKEKKDLISGKDFRQLKSMHQRYADVFEDLGFKVDISNPNFPDVRELSLEAQNMLGAKTQKWIGIAPFAQYKSKMYPLDLVEKVIETLSLKKTCKIILFGGGQIEAQRLEEMKVRYENVINLANRLPLNQELDIISNLDLMVSMDSGNAHIAAMLGKKVVTIWGVTHPFAGFYPYHQDRDLAILSDRSNYPKIPTSVYGNKFPSGYEDVARSIPSEVVLEKLESLL